jgi:hypothetical protein
MFDTRLFGVTVERYYVVLQHGKTLSVIEIYFLPR